MTGSAGAASAATSSRGNRNFSQEGDYEMILPNLPTGRFVINTVFLHGDVQARPYRVEDFRDALAGLTLLPEVIALGAYRMSHVWAVTFKSAEAVKKILAASEMKVKGRRCVVIDPGNQDVRMKVHWLLHNIPDDDVRVAFLPYGRVTEISRERWRVHGIADKGSTTRLVSLRLKAGVKLEDLPHQVNVAGEQALVVVSGRAPMCLRCHTTGHIRRDCRVPKCSACRRFGHEEGQCPKTYASVTGPSSAEEPSELLMDETDAEEAAKPSGDAATGKMVTLSASKSKLEERREPPAGEPQDQGPAVVKAATSKDTCQPTSEDTKVAENQETCMEVVESASGQPIKRPLEESVEEKADKRGEGTEPPFKEMTTRRTSIKPRPNISAERRSADKPPP
ncbi:uncharacterized protein LOC125942430 [Dermacentor silvarum]|uniref:uncharacterized protein LOC125942430 n=1 Tax=Dermacentor silvarum TaxID=543639 RepID=UPI0021013067|nr:uncharacterized protein LOC125942430 [Dermacentor silvarum]